MDRTNRVDMVIAHKLDRLARNRADDVQITQAITDSGARLVLSTEAIDESPSGQLAHGIMASIAEFYSRNLATEVSKGLRQKARNGGTPNEAPAGYRNVRTFDAQGREVRIVGVDEERAQVIRWVSTTYATGKWSLHRLAHGMTRLGFSFLTRMGKLYRCGPSKKESRASSFRSRLRPVPPCVLCNAQRRNSSEKRAAFMLFHLARGCGCWSGCRRCAPRGRQDAGASVGIRERRLDRRRL